MKKYYYVLHEFQHSSGEASNAYRLSNGQDIRTHKYVGIKEMTKEFYEMTVEDEKRIVASFSKNDKLLFNKWGLSTKHWHYPFIAKESEITQEFIEKKFNIKFKRFEKY
mgnify:CR=1 FL=1